MTNISLPLRTSGLNVKLEWNGMQSFGKALVDLYKHEFCIRESYFQN